jgi:hypothetical protein
MSCSTTTLGKFSVSFLKNIYGLNDSQAKSMFHTNLRLHRENPEYNSDLDSYHRSLSDLQNVLNGSTLSDSKKARLNSKLQEMVSGNPSSSEKYAIINLSINAEISKRLFDSYFTNLRVSNPGLALETEDLRENYERLVSEYFENKEIIDSRWDRMPRTALIDPMPQDKGTQYAISTLYALNRCSLCGRFVNSAVTGIHDCPVSQNLRDGLRLASSLSSHSEPARREYSEVVLPMSMEEFQDRYDLARSEITEGKAPPLLPYEEDGFVTGGLASRGKNTFGIELEVDFPSEEAEYDEWNDEYDYDSFQARYLLTQALFSEGIVISPQIQRWHYVGGQDRPGGEYREDPNGWVCEFDRSIDPYDGARGVEIKSQILFDEKRTWENIKKISDQMQRFNAKATKRTGMHINIGGSEFSSETPKAHNNLLKLAAAYDDVLIRLAHNPESGVQHRGRGYCAPANLPPEGYESVSSARAYSNHYQAFNLGHLPGAGESHRASSRVEVRFWDGATDLGRIQAAVAVSSAFVELALRGQKPENPNQLAGYTASTFGTGKLSGEQWEQATLPFRRFMSLMEIAGLKSQSHKKSLFHLFAESRWYRN